MSTTTLITELEAVNILLAATGESPVSSLSDSGLADVAEAKATLDEQSRLVQSRGWSFNTEYEYPLVPDTDGFITLPQNTLKADLGRGFFQVDAVQRGLRLYDRKNHTYMFESGRSLTGDMVFLLGFDELPQAVRYYITVKAARVYQARVLGSDTQYKFSEAEEMSALVALNSSENDQGDYNMLTGSWSVARTLDR
jgi:hypothetical protein